MAKGPGCLVDSGMLDNNGKLTSQAKSSFIQSYKDELTYGTANLPVKPFFDCGIVIPPNPNAALLDIENEERFPSFHENILGMYERIAVAMNLPSDFKFLPICDPVALGAKLGVNIQIENFPNDYVPFLIPNPPLLASKLNIMPPTSLITKFPEIPTIPPPVPGFEIPNLDPIAQSALFAIWLDMPKNMLTFFTDVALQMPKLILQLPNLPVMLETISTIAIKAEIFGPVGPASTTQAAAVKVLVQKVVEIIIIVAIGTTMGSASGGITGGISKLLGYSVPPPAARSSNALEESVAPRRKIIDFAESCVGLSLDNNLTKDEYARNLLYVEHPEPPREEYADRRAIGQAATISKLRKLASGGLLARACLNMGGAAYVFNSRVDTSRQDPSVVLYHDFFKDTYQVNTSIPGIMIAAKAKRALVKPTLGDLPANLKAGDIIIVHNPKKAGAEHAMIVAKDYVQNSYSLTTIEGGQVDTNRRPTAIRKNTYIKSRTVKRNSNVLGIYVNNQKNVIIGGRYVMAIIDSDRLCNDRTGTDLAKSNGEINVGDLRDGVGFGFQEFE